MSFDLQLSRGNHVMSADKILMMPALNEEDRKPNPVVERVKLIMIAGLFIVHAHRYLIFLKNHYKSRFDIENQIREKKRNFTRK